MPEDYQADDTHQAFYVGYLPLPRGLRRVLIIVVASLLAGLGGIVAAVATAQRDPGPAVWDTANRSTFVGIIHTQPYPIMVLDAPGSTGRTLLIVEQGKFAADPRFIGLDGQRVSVTGTVLVRDGRRMLELTADAIKPLPGPVGEPLTTTRIGDVVLVGEIMDSKCYLGAMKPGNGVTHRACAALCVKGGIPPMLVTRDAQGTASYFLLIDEAGGAANGLVERMVGQPVEVRGSLERLGDDLVVLRINGASVQRL